MTRRMIPFAIACSLAAPGLAYATTQEEPEPVALSDSDAIGAAVTLQLAGGEQLVGTLLAVDADTAHIAHRYLGELRIPRDEIITASRTIFVDGEIQPLPPAADPEPEQAADEPDTPALDIDEPSVTWTRQFELGLRGSSGNTERLNFDAGLALTREGERTTFTWDTIYAFAQDEGEQTANRFDTTARNEWRLDDPRWSLFAQGSYTFDEFQDWDSRVAGGGGIGYLIIDEEDTSLNLRLGAGASYEFGGMAEEEIVPELILGAEFKHAFADNNRFIATGELFPNLRDTGEFRSISTAAWELDIDRDGGLSLRLGVEHRYESMVEDAERNDLDYFARLVYSF